MPEKDGIHTQLIASAARRVLRPFGLIQKGRSRTWLADQGWWLIVVEFQPSGFSRGSYLNVGCKWLWNVGQYVSFEVGYRVENFHEFENERQCAQVADQLATVALEKVIEYRRRFPTVLQLSEHYLENSPNGFWPCFNAAIAHILSARAELGSRLLSECCVSTNDDPAWLTDARQVAGTLASVMNDPLRFREFISDRVQETRRLQKLPQLHQVDFGSPQVVAV